MIAPSLRGLQSLSPDDERAFWALTDSDPADYPPEVVQQVVNGGSVDPLRSTGWTPLIAESDMDVPYEMRQSGAHDGRGVKDKARLSRAQAALRLLQ